MELHLKIIGCLLIALSICHITFPWYFKWKEQLNSLVLVNRQLMYVHTFFIAVVVFLIGILSLTSAADLLHTRLGRRLALGLTIFWALRLGIQFFGYSPELWKGKWFETRVHIVFSLLWTYLTIVYGLVYWMNDNV